MGSPDTQTRILDAAEKLFAEKGFAATSLRGLTRTAQVNLAAVHYHFGSKEELLRATFERRIGPVNAERLRRLDDLEARPGAGPSVEDLLAAFLAPALALADSPDEGAHAFLRLVGRLNAEPTAYGEWLMEVFAEIERRFLPAFQGALPHLDRASLLWRLHFVIGTMCIALTDGERLVRISRGLCDPTDGETLLRHLVTFTAAGLRAPIPGHGLVTDRRAARVEVRP